jgi:hypothetical protein
VIWKPRYMAGVGCLILGALILVGKKRYFFLNHPCLFLGSLSYADLITLSSTSSLTLLFNSILSYKLLGEAFTRKDLYSLLLIGLGASLCVTFSSFESSTPDYEVRFLFIFLIVNLVTKRVLFIGVECHSVHADRYLCRLHEVQREEVSYREYGT